MEDLGNGRTRVIMQLQQPVTERLFVLDRNPTLLTLTGDEILFDPIDIHTFELLHERALSGETVARMVP